MAINQETLATHHEQTRLGLCSAPSGSHPELYNNQPRYRKTSREEVLRILDAATMVHSEQLTETMSSPQNTGIRDNRA